MYIFMYIYAHIYSKPEYNGLEGCVFKTVKDSRIGVCLDEGNRKMSLNLVNVRPVLATAPLLVTGEQALQHTASYCNTLQHTATHCNSSLQQPRSLRHVKHTATRCTTLQHTATHCSTLRHSAPHCNTLQQLLATAPLLPTGKNPPKSHMR